MKFVSLLVSQEPVLFSYSIRDNIAYGAVDPEAVTTEEIYGAARAANAFNFIQDFPNGFNTVVGEKGVLLSGEKQHRGVITTTTQLKMLKAGSWVNDTNDDIPPSLKRLYLAAIVHKIANVYMFNYGS